MTDNEIIKALECCWHSKECVGDECPLFEPINDCAPLMAMEALDLITRQRAEIERLEAENEKKRLILENIDNDLFPLPFVTDYDIAIKTAKSEAIREFAEKAKMNYDEVLPRLFADVLDDVMKEMEGENDG